MTAAEAWASALAGWGIPERILAGAPESPWIHPVSVFAVDPRHVGRSTPSEERALEGLALSGGRSVLDVGCGGGKAAFALVPPASCVIGVDEQPEMLARFAEVAEALGIEHEEIPGRWPEVVAPIANVVTCHHVFYNVAALGDFAEALSAHARQRVVAELPWHHPLAALAPAWRQFWDLARPEGPTAEDAVAVLHESGIEARLERFTIPADGPALPFEEQVRHMRIRLCLPAARDPEVAAFLRDHPVPTERQLAVIWWDVAARDQPDP